MTDEQRAIAGEPDRASIGAAIAIGLAVAAGFVAGIAATLAILRGA